MTAMRAPPFDAAQRVAREDKAYSPGAEERPSASPPRPPSVNPHEPPPRPPCSVETQFEARVGETNTLAMPAAAPPLPPKRAPSPPAPPVTVTIWLKVTCVALNLPSLFPKVTTPVAFPP